MLTLQFRGEEDFYRTLIRIERNVEKQSHDFLDKMGQWIVGDIRANWSSVSPSEAGQAPAKQTGNLDSSLQVEERYRTGGRFASAETAATIFIRVNTAEGKDPRNRGNYAQALETGTYKMAARPFLNPALERARDIMPHIARGSFKL